MRPFIYALSANPFAIPFALPSAMPFQEPSANASFFSTPRAESVPTRRAYGAACDLYDIFAKYTQSIQILHSKTYVHINTGTIFEFFENQKLVFVISSLILGPVCSLSDRGDEVSMCHFKDYVLFCFWGGA